MKQVSKEQFFKAIGIGDIITSAEGCSKDERGIWSLFKTRNHAEVGRIYSNPAKEYWLTSDRYNILTKG